LFYTVEMILRVTSRSGWRGRSMRAGVAWFALLALAVPGFASVRGLCCEPGLAKSTDCCASAMKMPGMDSSQMESMEGGAVAADRWVAVASTQCAPVPDSQIPEVLVRSEGTFDGSLQPTRDIHPALALNGGANVFSFETAALLLVEETPPRALRSDPLSVVLRI
jgi:hypothetical protein